MVECRERHRGSVEGMTKGRGRGGIGRRSNGSEYEIRRRRKCGVGYRVGVRGGSEPAKRLVASDPSTQS